MISPLINPFEKYKNNTTMSSRAVKLTMTDLYETFFTQYYQKTI